MWVYVAAREWKLHGKQKIFPLFEIRPREIKGLLAGIIGDTKSPGSLNAGGLLFLFGLLMTVASNCSREAGFLGGFTFAR